MEFTRRQNWALWIGIISAIIPGLMVSGFLHEANFLPDAGWYAIAAVGGAIAGALATPLWFRGAICGMAAGVGAMLGILLYVALRTAIFGGTHFFKMEFLIGLLIGCVPGLWLFGV